MTVRSSFWLLFIVPFLSLSGVGVSAAEEEVHPSQGRTWRTVSELPPEELREVDLATDTPRHAQIPYLPAEPYPYSPPYTAEEMGLLSTEFAHMPRRNCALVEAYGTIAANGYLTTAQAIGLVWYYVDSNPAMAAIDDDLQLSTRRPARIGVGGVGVAG
jgi:hypothetical protein